MAGLLETLVILSAAGAAPRETQAAVGAVAAGIGDEARHGAALAQAVEAEVSRPAGELLTARDVAILREALDVVARVYAVGDWAPAAETLERLRRRIEDSPVSLTVDGALRDALYEIRVMLADCWRRSGRARDADALMAEAIRGDPGRAPARERFGADALAFFHEVARAQDAAPRGALEVATTPPGLPIYLEGAFIGQSPAHARDLRPGRYRVIAGAGGEAGRVHELEVAGAERLAIDAELDRALRTGGGVALVFSDEAARAAREARHAARLGRALGARRVVLVGEEMDDGRRVLAARAIEVEGARVARSAAVALDTPPAEGALHALGRFVARGERGPALLRFADPDAAARAGHGSARAWKWIATAASVAAAGAGAFLLAIDGSCARESRAGACADRRETAAPGLATLGAGAALGLGAAGLSWLDGPD